MATWREQNYSGRGNGWGVECSVCGWWKAPVWNRLDAICDCGTHELICPGPADNPYPPFFRASPKKDSSSEEDLPIRPDKNDGEQAMIATKPKAGNYYLLKDMGLDRLVRIGRVARERGTETVYAWYREHSWSTGQELSGIASRRELRSFMKDAKVISDLPAMMKVKEAEVKQRREQKDAQATQDAATCEECSAKTHYALGLAERTLRYILDNDREPGKSPEGVAIQLNAELRHRVEKSLEKLAEEIR